MKKKEDSTPTQRKRSPELASALRQARELLGISLRKAAENAGISPAYLSQLEAGDVRDPSPRVLYELAKAYARPDTMPLDELYAAFMSKADYFVPGQSSERVLYSRFRSPFEMALNTASPLTADEQKALAEYLAWYRSRNGRSAEGRTD